eukprot:CAMPEP_0116896620 /NCGR_PEP_ID=MMETSP0467-20121206/5808_1 /TAXON_ID=283647 /ORGANISM="Mesodinium pulex, Strain SPMC105" /LENGTH=71 /DNA_ID=CAMNT_0004567861 /DNA_START=957 /DNA_END=1172 /DNA_ORIENTATION=+
MHKDDLFQLVKYNTLNTNWVFLLALFDSKDKRFKEMYTAEFKNYFNVAVREKERIPYKDLYIEYMINARKE